VCSNPLRVYGFPEIEVTGYLAQFVCCVGQIRISLTLTRCGWPTDPEGLRHLRGRNCSDRYLALLGPGRLDDPGYPANDWIR
jgi:hypothetical protein